MTSKAATSLAFLTLALGLVASAVAGDIYVVPSNPNAAAPYDTWETASADIVAAINNAAPSSTVHVAKGTYKTAATIVVPLAVKVLGATGNRNDVIIDAQRKCRVIDATAGRAYIAGITIRGGKLSGKSDSRIFGAGIDLRAKGTISNCHVTACATGDYVSGAGMFIRGSYAFDVLVDFCTNAPTKTVSYSTKGYAVTVDQASLVDRCQVLHNVLTNGKYQSNYFGGALAIYNNSSADYATTCIARNCLVAHNVVQAFTEAGAMASGVSLKGGIIENCTIVSNIVNGTSGNAFGATVFSDNNGTIRNCHIADNYNAGTLKNYSTISLSGGGPGYLKRFMYCATAPLDHRFVNCVLDDTSKYGFGNRGRLFITKDSPCFGAAQPQNWMASAKDVYGRPRIHYANCDIGAVEYHPAPGTFVQVQ